jgi:hypothetical protein
MRIKTVVRRSATLEKCVDTLTEKMVNYVTPELRKDPAFKDALREGRLAALHLKHLGEKFDALRQAA